MLYALLGSMATLLFLMIVAGAFGAGWVMGRSSGIESVSASADACGTVIAQDDEPEDEEQADGPPHVMGFKPGEDGK